MSPDIGRAAPQYLNVRQKVTPDGADVDLNATDDVMTPLGEGATGFATTSTTPPMGGSRPVARSWTPRFRLAPAYSIVCPPSFYPYASQRALTEWAEQEAPAELRDGIWAIPPRPLSDRRLAANITLPVRFSIDDDTVTALVSMPMDTPAQQSGEPATQVRRHLQLPDAAAGIFDPGWEVTLDRTTDNRFFLTGYGLGSPFIEDAKLCATLSTFWPGVSPDSAREFQPNKPIAPGESQVWPTIAPMTDEELGIVAVDGQEVLPWDGVQGPRLIQVDGVDVVDYPAILHTDYLNTVDRFTAALTSKVDQEAYVARVLAMAQVYWALGIRYADFRDRYELAEALDRFQAAKGEWSVLSYRIVAGDDAELGQAQSRPEPPCRAMRCIVSTCSGGTARRCRVTT